MALQKGKVIIRSSCLFGSTLPYNQTKEESVLQNVAFNSYSQVG